MGFYILLGCVGLGVLVFLSVVLSMAFRVVVPTNSVHIVQTSKSRLAYGKALDEKSAGNTYYKWPSWVPYIGVRVTNLPLSVFQVELENYSAYDKGRLPFALDVLAFFRISDPAKAAESISSIDELDSQLRGIMQGVVRTILAQSEIESILGDRAKFSELFTHEVKEQLPQWGIEAVKNIELMDIRDEKDSKVIFNIMAKKKSEIEMESRVAVAGNQKTAGIAEIAANQAIKTSEQEAVQAVGIRTAQQEQAVGIAKQVATQAVQESAKVTAEKVVAVSMVQEVGAANIVKAKSIVEAEQLKEVAIIGADANKAKTVTIAEGQLQATTLEAQGKQKIGEAEGAAETARLMAPVTAQTELAQKIGENVSYQDYLVRIEVVRANKEVGVEQAKALGHADIKVIASAGSPQDGTKSVMDLFTPKGGVQLAGAVEAFAQSDVGAALISKVTGAGSELPKK